MDWIHAAKVEYDSWQEAEGKIHPLFSHHILVAIVINPQFNGYLCIFLFSETLSKLKLKTSNWQKKHLYNQGAEYTFCDGALKQQINYNVQCNDMISLFVSYYIGQSNFFSFFLTKTFSVWYMLVFGSLNIGLPDFSSKNLGKIQLFSLLPSTAFPDFWSPNLVATKQGKSLTPYNFELCYRLLRLCIIILMYDF